MEAYNKRIINNVIWIKKEYSLSDVMTKSSVLPQLVEPMKTWKIHYEVEKSVI